MHRTSMPSSASAAATQTFSPIRPQLLRSEEEWEADLGTRPPTLAQLASLTALPITQSARGSRTGAKKKAGGKKQSLIRDGAIDSRFFDCLGRRPYPTNNLSLEQSVRCEMMINLGILTTSSATAGLPTFASTNFSISAFSGASALLSVFDQYRIEQLEVWLETPTQNGTVAYPVLVSTIDLDDSTIPTALSQVQDHQGALMGELPGGHYHRWKPHMAVAAYSGTFTSYSNEVAGWIDAASPNVQHYGLKLATISQGAQIAVNCALRAVVSFRAPVIN